MSNQYVGETVPKKLMRLQLYTVVKHLWKHTFHPGGWAVTLAGPEACEVGVLRHMLRFPVEKSMLVDRDPGGVAAAQTKWPGVNTYLGDIREGIEKVSSIGFAHFDFMGHFNDIISETVDLVRHKLRPGAVIAYTYLRGREMTGKTPHWDTMQAETKAALCDGPARERMEDERFRLDTTRSIGYARLLRQRLMNGWLPPSEKSVCGRHDLEQILLSTPKMAPPELVFLGRYNSGRSPMGVIAMQVMPDSMRGTRWQKAIRQLYNLPESRNDAPSGEEAVIAMKKKCVSLRKKGMPLSEVASVMNVEPSTITAWLAHDTRGTYEAMAV